MKDRLVISNLIVLSLKNMLHRHFRGSTNRCKQLLRYHSLEQGFPYPQHTFPLLLELEFRFSWILHQYRTVIHHMKDKPLLVRMGPLQELHNLELLH